MKRYKVKQGDTLLSIAIAFGVTEEAIKRANDLKTNTITIGQILIIPSEIKTITIKNISMKKSIDNLRVSSKIPETILKIVRDTCGCSTPKENFPYTEKTFNKIKEIAPLIKHYANKYSVPPIAIAGSIADEYNIINESNTSKIINWLQDDIVINFMPNFAIEFDVFVGGNSKLNNATKHDLGIGNIKLETAKTLYEQYKQYFTVKNWDYKDIVDYIQSNEGTVHLAALVIKKAKSILENHCIDYSECKKEAVYVTYYKQGDNYVKKFLDKKKKDTKHNIIPGEGCRVAKQRKKFLEIFL